jgi:hypothetical protein
MLPVGLDPDSDLRGLSVLGDVGQRFPQHRQDIPDDGVVNDCVQRPHELYVRTDRQHGRKLIDHREGATTQRPGRILPEREYRGPDLLDRLVELVDGAREALLDDLLVHSRSDALQTESRGEQPLDDMIMEIARNAPPIYQDAEPLLISSSVAQLQGDGSLTRESFSHVEVGISEWCVRGDPAGHDRTARTGFPSQRKGHGLAHRNVGPQVHIDIGVPIQEVRPHTITLLHRLPSHAVVLGVTKSDKLTFGGPGSNDDLQLAWIIAGRSHERNHIG